MIFPIIKAESILQVGDKTRIFAVESFISGQDTIDKVEIDPDSSGTYFEVTNPDPENWFLDWLYETPGSKTVKLKITDSALNEKEVTKDIQVLTAEEDALFSNDRELNKYFSGIRSYLPKGKTSYNHIHREVQSIIIDKLDRKQVRDDQGNRLSKDVFKDNEEVRMWATYLALEIILQDLSNEPGDKWEKDSMLFRDKAEVFEGKSYLRFDTNKDGTVEEREGKSFSGIPLIKKW